MGRGFFCGEKTGMIMGGKRARKGAENGSCSKRLGSTKKKKVRNEK